MKSPFSPALTLILLTLAAATIAVAETAPDPDIVVYREVDGQALSAHVFMPERNDDSTPTAAVLLFHGGGWVVGTPEWTYSEARNFASLGMVAVAVEYRLSGETVTPIDALADARAAFRWIREHADEFGVDPARVAGYGVSAGGHLAAAAATVRDAEPAETNSRPDLLLLWSPAVDVAGDGWFCRLIQGHGEASAYAPADQVGLGSPPACIVQGELDTLTPLSGAEKYRRAVIAAGGICEVNVYPGVGHLLTRNLEYQEGDFDPDPEKRADGRLRLESFLRKHGFISRGEV